ncbi:hypothetical protein GMDG_07969 [Pseudogymnoascus destructans 20631-21]|uniref:Uncharacterized protein n=1 Tax=Pseudogymnoascus destructans (strain ATCC MYA-4855 / 20631-21) TaxID=658429 RepID=L8G0Y5_PSED2|nr:hypothetical protein GMDG_07969 [Pseudogymnoascus destructans 20631-21]
MLYIKGRKKEKKEEGRKKSSSYYTLSTPAPPLLLRPLPPRARKVLRALPLQAMKIPRALPQMVKNPSAPPTMAKKSLPPASPSPPPPPPKLGRSVWPLVASLGDCHDQPGAIPGVGRCWRCASGHSCMPVPAAVAPSAAALLAGLAADPALSVAKRNRLRGYVRDALAVADKKPGGSSSAPAPTNDLAAAPGFGAPVPLSGFGAPVSLSAVAFGQFGAPSPFGAHVLGSFAAPPPPAQGAQLGALLAQLGGLLAPSPGGPSVLARRAMIMAILGQVVDSLLE